MAIPEGPPGTVAFVPDSVPRRLDLGISTVRLLSQAENALGRLQGSVGRMVNPYLIARPLLRREALISSRMEGTKTTAAKLVSWEARPVGHTDEETREVNNYIVALTHGLAALKELPVCLRLIRDLHAKLLSGVRGERDAPGRFRIVQNFIGHSDIASARFVPPPPSELEPVLRDLEAFLNEEDTFETLPLLVRLALAHYQFETIHPFEDGNGRVGRLLIPLTLHVAERLDSPTLYLSSFFEHHKRDYVDLMLAVSQTGAYEDWVQFFLKAVRTSAEESVRQAHRLTELRDRYHAKFHQARSSALTLKLIDNLFELPLITIGGVSSMLQVTPATAMNHIQRLVDVGIVAEVSGRSRDRQYLAPELLRMTEPDDEQDSAEPAPR